MQKKALNTVWFNYTHWESYFLFAFTLIDYKPYTFNWKHRTKLVKIIVTRHLCNDSFFSRCSIWMHCQAAGRESQRYSKLVAPYLQTFWSDSSRSRLIGLKSGHWARSISAFHPLLPSSSPNNSHTLLWGVLGLLHTVTVIVYNCPVEVTHFLSYRNHLYQHSQTQSFSACLIKLCVFLKTKPIIFGWYVEHEMFARPWKSDGEMWNREVCSRAYKGLHLRTFTWEISEALLQLESHPYAKLHRSLIISEFSSTGELHIMLNNSGQDTRANSHFGAQTQQCDGLYYWGSHKSRWTSKKIMEHWKVCQCFA